MYKLTNYRKSEKLAVVIVTKLCSDFVTQQNLTNIGIIISAFQFSSD